MGKSLVTFFSLSEIVVCRSIAGFVYCFFFECLFLSVYRYNKLQVFDQSGRAYYLSYFIIMQYTLYVADSPAANETHTLWFLIFVKSTRGSVAVCVVDQLMLVTVKVLTLLLHVNALFHFIIESLSKAIRPIL